MKIKDYKENIKLLLDTKDNKTIANGLAKMIKYVEQSYNIPKDKKLYFLFGNSKKLDWDLYCKTDGGEFDYCDIAELYTSENAEQVAAFYLLYVVMLNEFHDAVERHLMSAPTDTETVAPTDTAPQPLEIPDVLKSEKAQRIFTAFQQTNVKVKGKSEPKPIVICYNDHWEFATKSLAAYIAETLQKELSETNMFAIIERVAGYKPRSLQNLLTDNRLPNGCREVDKIINSIK